MTATLHVIFGPSGAGKTTYAHAFARREKAVAFILDDWMARLFGPDMPDPIEYDWMIERVQRCEAQIWSVVAGCLAAGAVATGLDKKCSSGTMRGFQANLPIKVTF